jgi:hypothetical protein
MIQQILPQTKHLLYKLNWRGSSFGEGETLRQEASRQGKNMVRRVFQNYDRVEAQKG